MSKCVLSVVSLLLGAVSERVFSVAQFAGVCEIAAKLLNHSTTREEGGGHR